MAAALGEIRAGQEVASREARGEQLLQAALGPARVRLGTLNNLRWLAVIGQTVAVLIVSLLLKFDFPIFEASIVIGASAILNVVLSIAYPSSKRLTVREATAFLGYDITQLAVLLFLTGGIENPFALLFLAPVVVSAATLNVASTLFLGGLSVAAITLLAFAHIPLPWRGGTIFILPDLYQLGIWVSLLLGIGFSSIYAWRIASEATRMSAALSATQLALAREHRLAALGGLAAAAAHELGTPLGTIALVARELEHALSSNPHADDFRLLRAEAERCRAILTRLAQPEDSVLGRAEQLPLGAFLDDIAAPHRGEDVSIVVDIQEGPPPKIWRVPEILHGLGNLVENAADFAASEVRLRARWDDKELAIDVMDDGPGFAAEIFEQIGEPYVTSRPRPVNPTTKGSHSEFGKEEGMGLGFFIAKTLIEQTGGTVTARNRNRGGAIVTARWSRGAIDGEEAPREEFHL
jgi:two-component system, sensor histidine kinase RegB